MTSSIQPASQEYLLEYRGNTLIAVCAVFIILETIFVGLRYYARRLTPIGFGWDDAFIPLAWSVNMALCILSITTVYNAGVGRHEAEVLEDNPAKLIVWAKSIFAVEILFLTCNVLPKISVLLLYLHVFTNRSVRAACHILLGFILVAWVALVITGGLQCTPFDFQWDKTIPRGHCFNQQAYYWSASLPNVLTDVLLLVLPIPTVYHLKVSIARRLGLGLVFLMGSVGLISSCIRISIFFRKNAFIDSTWTSVDLLSWTVIEPGMYLIATCLLSFRPLLQKFLPKELGTRLRVTYPLRSSDRVRGGESQNTYNKVKPGHQPNAGFVELQSGDHNKHSTSLDAV